MPSLSSPNLNDVRPSGWYYCNSATNAPPVGGGFGYFSHRQVNTDYAVQEFIPAGGGVSFTREKVAGAWRAWTDDLPLGSIVNSVSAQYTGNIDVTGTIPFDDTIPQITEGFFFAAATITPRSITNKLRVRFIGSGSVASAPAGLAWAIFDGSANALSAGYVTVPTANYLVPMVDEFEYVPGSLAARTISVRAGSTSLFRLNGNTVGRFFGGVNASVLIVEEIKA